MFKKMSKVLYKKPIKIFNVRFLRRKCQWFTFLLFVILVLILFQNYYPMKNDELNSTIHKCEVTSQQKQNLFTLLKSVSDILEKLGITYFLCYSSLWGAIQESGPLPWDANAELCILSSKLLLHDEASIYRAFLKAKLSLEYSSAEGEYTVRYSENSIDLTIVKLLVFEADSRVGGMLRRVGWKRRLLPPDCDAHPSLQCFPPHLIDPIPLPKKSFGPLNMPSPKEDIDLLKFHYPDTWWKPLKPKC